jgi:hypothetical protein
VPLLVLVLGHSIGSTIAGESDGQLKSAFSQVENVKEVSYCSDSSSGLDSPRTTPRASFAGKDAAGNPVKSGPCATSIALPRGDVRTPDRSAVLPALLSSQFFRFWLLLKLSYNSSYP